jgi:hypothetical protein
MKIALATDRGSDLLNGTGNGIATSNLKFFSTRADHLFDDGPETWLLTIDPVG